jgi:hypothetical protein
MPHGQLDLPTLLGFSYEVRDSLSLGATAPLTIWTKPAARLHTEEMGDKDPRHRSSPRCRSSTEPKDASAGWTPVAESNVEVLLRGGMVVPAKVYFILAANEALLDS